MAAAAAMTEPIAAINIARSCHVAGVAVSDTETIAPPPANEFIADDTGLTLWRAELDGITVRRVFNGVLVEAFHGDHRLVHTLSADHAKHLAKLLSEAAE